MLFGPGPLPPIDRVVGDRADEGQGNPCVLDTVAIDPTQEWETVKAQRAVA